MTRLIFRPRTSDRERRDLLVAWSGTLRRSFVLDGPPASSWCPRCPYCGRATAPPPLPATCPGCGAPTEYEPAPRPSSRPEPYPPRRICR